MKRSVRTRGLAKRPVGAASPGTAGAAGVSAGVGVSL